MYEIYRFKDYSEVNNTLQMYTYNFLPSYYISNNSKLQKDMFHYPLPFSFK